MGAEFSYIVTKNVSRERALAETVVSWIIAAKTRVESQPIAHGMLGEDRRSCTAGGVLPSNSVSLVLTRPSVAGAVGKSSISSCCSQIALGLQKSPRSMA